MTRFKDKLRLKGTLDNLKFKSNKELIGGGDMSWKFKWSTKYKIDSWKELPDKYLTIHCMLDKLTSYGSVQVDLWTCCTGTVEHNLPLLDANKHVVGRLDFWLQMEQVCNVAVIFKSVKLRHLKPVGDNGECNPYLKYAYSKTWEKVQDGRVRATYTEVQHNTTSPLWEDLPEIRFHATMKELLQESVVLHVTHNGTLHNTTLGRCNLLFRTLVDNGKTFKDEDLISFKGPLKVDNAEIEGILLFKFLPMLAQMKPVSVVRKAIHTEKGIYDAMPLLSVLPKPDVPIILTDESPSDVNTPITRNAKDNESVEEDKPFTGRARAQTSVNPTRMFSPTWKAGPEKDKPKDKEKEKLKDRVMGRRRKNSILSQTHESDDHEGGEGHLSDSVETVSKLNSAPEFRHKQAESPILDPKRSDSLSEATKPRAGSTAVPPVESKKQGDLINFDSSPVVVRRRANTTVNAGLSAPSRAHGPTKPLPFDLASLTFQDPPAQPANPVVTLTPAFNPFANDSPQLESNNFANFATFQPTFNPFEMDTKPRSVSRGSDTNPFTASVPNPNDDSLI